MKKHKVEVVERRPADENHQVVQLKGDSGYQRKPCPTCPWRKSEVGTFPAEAFRISAHTAYDQAEEMFACHAAGLEHPLTCAGFLLQNADNNLGVRFSMIAGKVDYSQISADGIDLWESYRAMAVANGVDPDDPRLAPCRGNDEWR